MKKTLLVVGIAVIAAFGLSGCNNTADSTPPIDPNYKACIQAGGTYKYSGWSSSFSCTMPKDKH